MSDLAVQAVRTPEQIGKEIRTLTYQAKGMTVYFGIEIGRRLAEAKQMVGHGAWGEWIKNETEFSQSTATRFMRIFEEYGALQLGIFGAVENSSTLQNISISNALRLLALPSEEREEFAKEVDAENISARELERAIRERDEAKRRAEDAKKEMAEQLEEQQRVYDVDMESVRSELAAAEGTVEQLREEIKALRERPVEVAVEVDESAVSKAAEEAAAKAEQEWSAKLSAAEKKLAAAEKEKASLEGKVKKLEKAAEKSAAGAVDAEALAGEVESLKKQLAMSDAAVTAFKVKFEAWQAAWTAVNAALAVLNEEQKEKMLQAMRAQLGAWEATVAPAEGGST